MKICNKWQPIETCPEEIEVDVLMESNGEHHTTRLKKHKGKFYYLVPGEIITVNAEAGYYLTDFSGSGINLTHWQNTAAVFAS